MPELPEVQTIVSDLNEMVSRRVISEVAVRLPKMMGGDADPFLALLPGAQIEEVIRLGKWVCFKLDRNKLTLVVHLRMTGQFELGPWPETDHWPLHCHVALRLNGFPPDQEALLYRDIRQFGRWFLLDPTELNIHLKKLGPDSLLISPEEFHTRLTKKKSSLKSVLLDQSVIAGLGNIYVDESLFAARLSPTRSAASLVKEETDRLLAEIKRLLTASIATRGSTTSNYKGLKGPGSFQHQHQVYRHSGQPCPACGAQLERSVVAGRTTTFCPDCQR